MSVVFQAWPASVMLLNFATSSALKKSKLASATYCGVVALVFIIASGLTRIKARLTAKIKACLLNALLRPTHPEKTIPRGSDRPRGHRIDRLM